jgi:surface protein
MRKRSRRGLLVALIAVIAVVIWVAVSSATPDSSQPDVLEGTVCAVLSDDGTFTFLRTDDSLPGNGSQGTVTSVSGGEFAGRIYSAVDAGRGEVPLEDYSGVQALPWAPYSPGDAASGVTRVAFKDTIRPKSTAQWFAGCENLASVDLSGLDTSSATNMQQMFAGCSSLTSLTGLDGLDTSDVGGFAYMFEGCSSLRSLDVSWLETGSAIDMTSMFKDCANLGSLTGMDGWDTSDALTFAGMFEGCSSLTSLDVSGLDTAQAKSVASMFAGCSGLTRIVGLDRLDTGRVLDFAHTFSHCGSLESLDSIGDWDTSKESDMAGMFEGDRALSEIALGPKFSFSGEGIDDTDSKALLPTPDTGDGTYTGRWVKSDDPSSARTAEELRDDYDADASALTGTWVWERKPE